MSGLGAAGFVEGLQGGIAARDQMDRNKQFKQMRKLGIAEKTHELAGKREMAMADQQQQLGDDFSQEDFDAEWGAFQQDKDPALLRLGKWMGGKLGNMFGGGGGGEEAGAQAQMAIATPEVQPPGPQASGATTYAIPDYADGGAVPSLFDEQGNRRNLTPEEISHRTYGKYYVTEEEAASNRAARSRGEHRNRNPYGQRYGAGVDRQGIYNDLSGGGVRAAGRDLARSTANVFDDTISGAVGGQKLIDAADAELANAEGAREYGTAVRGTGAAALTSAAETTGGLLKDVFVDNPITQGVAGFLGFDGEGAIPEPTDVPTTPEGDAIGASVDNPDVPAEAVAAAATEQAQKESIENLDYRLLVDQGVRPEDLPSMSTSDWAGYRQRMTLAAAKTGMTPVEAHGMVDQRITQTQMTGFQREGQKAMLYLQSGQNREAAMALRQAYQYFPNGVTVKFGTMIDPKTGQPAIMTMGVDEETGEPTGSPMLITTERLTTMMENMQNPDAFRSWTKDGRDLQMEINKLQSIDDYRQGTLDVAAYNAETDRIGELTGGTGGLRPADRDRRDKEYGERMAEAGIMEEGFEDPNVTRSLASAMTIYEQLSGLDMNTVTHEILAAYQDDPQNGVQRLLESARGQ